MSEAKGPIYRKCKYCKHRAMVGKDVCSYCEDKLKLVRKLVALGSELREILEKREREDLK